MCKVFKVWHAATSCILRVVRQRSPSIKENNLPRDCSAMEHMLLRKMLSQLNFELQHGVQGKEYFLLSNATVRHLDVPVLRRIQESPEGTKIR